MLCYNIVRMLLVPRGTLGSLCCYNVTGGGVGDTSCREGAFDLLNTHLYLKPYPTPYNLLYRLHL